jgi:hypothetical protein
MNAEIDSANSLFLGSGDEGYVGKNTIGKSYPSRLRKFEGQAFQN